MIHVAEPVVSPKSGLVLRNASTVGRAASNSSSSSITIDRPGAHLASGSGQRQPVIDLRSDEGGFGQEEEDREVMDEPVSEVEGEVRQALTDR